MAIFKETIDMQLKPETASEYDCPITSTSISKVFKIDF